MTRNPRPGDRCLFRTSASTGPNGPIISLYDRHTCEIIRAVTEDEADAEVGPMFVVRFDDGHEDDAFIDELEIIA